MFSFTAARNDTFKRADLVANLKRETYVPGLIKPSIILNACNVCPFAYSNKVRLTRLLPL